MNTNTLLNTSLPHTLASANQLRDMCSNIQRFNNSLNGKPSKAFCTQAYIDSIKRSAELSIKDPEIKLPDGALMTILGMPVCVSKILPKGVLAVFFNSENLPVKLIVDETYEPQEKKP